MTVHALALPTSSDDGTSTDTAEVFRLSLGALVASGSTAMEARSGLFPTTGAALLTTGSAMAANIAPFTAWVDGSSGAGQGGYLVTSTASEPITFADGETSVARVDRVVCQIQHDTYDASGQRRARVVYLKGQTSGVASAVPASSLLLWEMTVPAGTSSGSGGLNFANAVDKRVWTVARGGQLPVASQAERDAISAPHTGMAIWRTDYAWHEAYDGTAWRVQGLALLPTLANATRITNPLTGQLAMANDGPQLYRYDGAAWSKYPSATSAAVVGDLANVSRGTTTSNTYTSSLTTSTDDPVSVTFTAPSTGAVWVNMTPRIAPTSGESFVSFQITNTSTSAVVVAAIDSNSVSSAYNGPVRSTGRRYVTGLTPGTQYTCTMMFRAASGTPSFDPGDLIVEAASA
jgi:hypothetical protein